MRRMLGRMVAVLVLAASPVSAGQSGETGPLLTPETIGDQVISYYDTRADFTTFFTLRNTSGGEVVVSILFYGPTFSTPFSKAVTLAGGALEIVDVGRLRGEGLPAQPGVAIATVIDLGGRPIVTRALAGNFTIANLQTGSAFGAGAAARSAIEDDGDLPARGTVIDGSGNAAFRPIQPSSALLAAYYDPSDLAPVSASGNQLIFVNFEDTYTPSYGASIGSTTWQVSTTRSNGAGIGDTAFTANGVTVTDLASVAGTGVNGAAGNRVFVADPGNPTLSRLIYFTESLGTFGTGYLLPPIPPQ